LRAVQFESSLICDPHEPMAKRRKNETEDRSCVYCGSAVQLTREHVFPKNLFLPPKPKNLVTVPACKSCNESYDQDDEYFRAYVVTPAFEETTGRKMWDERSLDLH